MPHIADERRRCRCKNADKMGFSMQSRRRAKSVCISLDYANALDIAFVFLVFGGSVPHRVPQQIFRNSTRPKLTVNAREMKICACFGG
jgi:hypothetical protein